MSDRASLPDRLARAKAEVFALEREIAAASCRDVGHDWKHIGGANAGCERGRDCGCSVPVHECTKCGDCDYGDNDEGNETRENCARDIAAMLQGAT